MYSITVGHPMAFLSNWATWVVSSGCGSDGWGPFTEAGSAGLRALGWSFAASGWSFAAGGCGGGVESFIFSGSTCGTCVSLLAGVATGTSLAPAGTASIKHATLVFGVVRNQKWIEHVWSSALFPAPCCWQSPLRWPHTEVARTGSMPCMPRNAVC